MVRHERLQLERKGYSLPGFYVDSANEDFVWPSRAKCTAVALFVAGVSKLGEIVPLWALHLKWPII